MESTTKPRNMEAVRIYLDGGDVKAYLKKCGSKNPDNLWYYIKNQLKKTDPETWEKINGGPKPKKTAPEKPDAKPAGLIRIETPEGEVVHKVEVPEQKPDDGLKKPLERIVGPCHIDKFLITAIKHPELGEFYYDKKFEAVDWRTAEGDEISMSPSGWNSLLKELPHILRILGASR